eukprot:7464183-Ditylum_brightwellii.AAC.1
MPGRWSQRTCARAWWSGAWLCYMLWTHQRCLLQILSADARMDADPAVLLGHRQEELLHRLRGLEL